MHKLDTINKYSKSEKLITLTDVEALKETHQLVRDDEDDLKNSNNWKVRMARRYYDRLYKEYAIIDLSRYKEGLYGLRWRTEKEVIELKGENICGSKFCDNINNINSYELPFKYIENSITKRELIKVRLCLNCFKMLTYIETKNKQVINNKIKESKKRNRDNIEV